jgi:hypothetical protein
MLWGSLCGFRTGFLDVFCNFVTAQKHDSMHTGPAMKRFGSFIKGYTLGTIFVLAHVATHELRMRRLSH